MLSYKFDEGDKVKVVDDGQLYDTHRTFGERYLGWENGRHPRRKTKYRIIGRHMQDSDAIYAIENASGQVYLYGESGLELLSSPKPSSAKEPDWLVIHHNGDRCPSGGVWAGLTIEDVETKWYVYREMSTEFPSRRDCLQFVNHVEHGHRPLDATRAAYMLLRFAEEEEKL